jgi:hypothetical protein
MLKGSLLKNEENGVISDKEIYLSKGTRETKASKFSSPEDNSVYNIRVLDISTTFICSFLILSVLFFCK